MKDKASSFDAIPSSTCCLYLGLLTTIRIILLSSLLGCASPQVVEKAVPIEVVRTSYVPLAEFLLAQCEGIPTPLANGVTNAELRQGYLVYKIYSSCLESHLDAIRALQPKNQ